MDASPLTASLRAVTVDDLPWVLSLAYRRYRPFDPGDVLLFLCNVIKSPHTLFIRSESAFLIAAVVIPLWQRQEPECHVMFVCADEGAHWQAAKLAKQSVAWARSRGCLTWRCHSDTDNSVESLCRWVGAKPDTPRYVLDLTGE